jgi:membrane protein implicated in regulation of membrane protease activity
VLGPIERFLLWFGFAALASSVLLAQATGTPEVIAAGVFAICSATGASVMLHFDSA